jgi:adenylyltransferase/sulfurtransferase
VNEVLARSAPVLGWGNLSGATVIVVGVGGLGTVVAEQLARAGVGRLVLCDLDVVEEGNLSRGALFTREHVGLKKVDAAKRALWALTTAVTVDARADDFRYAIGLGEIRAASLVVSCLDSVADRIALCAKCLFADAPRGLLDAGLHPWGGEVRHYTADGLCYVCGCSPVDCSLPGWHAACGLPGPMNGDASVTATVAGMQARYARRLLHVDLEKEEAKGQVEQIVRIDASGRAQPVTQETDPHCPCHEVIDQESISPVPISNQATVGELLAFVREDEQVQAWNPIDKTNPVSPLTLRSATRDARLADLGIPPGEILPVVRVQPEQHVRYLSLTGAP